MNTKTTGRAGSVFGVGGGSAFRFNKQSVIESEFYGAPSSIDTLRSGSSRTQFNYTSSLFKQPEKSVTTVTSSRLNDPSRIGQKSRQIFLTYAIFKELNEFY
jgi:hypothetical protein